MSVKMPVSAQMKMQFLQVIFYEIDDLHISSIKLKWNNWLSSICVFCTWNCFFEDQKNARENCPVFMSSKKGTSFCCYLGKFFRPIFWMVWTMKTKLFASEYFWPFTIKCRNSWFYYIQFLYFCLIEEIMRQSHNK